MAKNADLYDDVLVSGISQHLNRLVPSISSTASSECYLSVVLSVLAADADVMCAYHCSSVSDDLTTHCCLVPGS